MTPSDAACRLWDTAVLCGRLDAAGRLPPNSSALRRARQRALDAGCSQSSVDHATVCGLEWGRGEVADEVDQTSTTSLGRRG